jgi:hypothetical protein|tara:strand:- start:34 stop:333 length:300 start_codon:yes stop_codon:yes gene_type:complete
LTNNTETGYSVEPTLPNDPNTKPFYNTRDINWLYDMVQKQYYIDPNWFNTNTPYPINTTITNTTTPLLDDSGNVTLDSNGNVVFELLIEQSISSYWYKV